MKYAYLMLGVAVCAGGTAISAAASAESATLICMWPDGRPTKVGINYDTRTVTWQNNTTPAKITDTEVSWEKGDAGFSLNRRSSKIRITGWGGNAESSNSYTCTKTAP
ncbi:MAG TPA: hypothetical protein VKU84_01575 [Stellaceae bacterium]|nr:hypothetical protein [Stellaceae bacterium]